MGSNPSSPATYGPIPILTGQVRTGGGSDVSFLSSLIRGGGRGTADLKYDVYFGHDCSREESSVPDISGVVHDPSRVATKRVVLGVPLSSSSPTYYPFSVFGSPALSLLGRVTRNFSHF